MVTQTPYISFYSFFGRQLRLLQFAVDKIFENDGENQDIDKRLLGSRLLLLASSKNSVGSHVTDFWQNYLTQRAWPSRWTVAWPSPFNRFVCHGNTQNSVTWPLKDPLLCNLISYKIWGRIWKMNYQSQKSWNSTLKAILFVAWPSPFNQFVCFRIT